MNKITVVCEISDNRIVDGMLTEWAELNKITRRKCMPLSYIKNIMDDDSGRVYAWFVDDDTNTNYLLEID